MWWPYLDGREVPIVPDYRKRAEKCVRLAQFAKAHHRIVLLDAATKWLELAEQDAQTLALRDGIEVKKRNDQAMAITVGTGPI
jgi:hypothetical protein